MKPETKCEVNWVALVIVAIWLCNTIGVCVTNAFGKETGILGYSGATFITFCVGIGYIILKFKEEIKAIVKKISED